MHYSFKRCRYLLQVDVVQVVACSHRLHHPALGGVEVQGEERRLRHVQELGQGPGREAAVSLEHHLRLQHVAVEAAGSNREITTVPDLYWKTLSEKEQTRTAT